MNLSITKLFSDCLWANVQKTRTCWLWIGRRMSEGYGQINLKGVGKSTHRLSWELTYGPIPVGICVLHKCDNRRCVRPDHLFLGTRADNLVDMRRKGREARGEKVANKGVKNGNSKLNDTIVREIRQLRLEGRTIVEIARRYGVDHTLISMIARGKIWKHVDADICNAEVTEMDS